MRASLTPTLDTDLQALRARGDARLDPAIAAGADPLAWSRALARGHVPEILADAQVPRWADPARIRRANRFFFRHAVSLSLSLGTVSLLQCYAAADGASALYAARRMVEQTERRVGETGQFILGLHGPGAWLPGGTGVPLVLRIRVLHAVTRARIRASGFAGDLPINQEDQLGTLLAFGLTPHLCLRELGGEVSTDDVEDSLHLWAIVGHLSGIDARVLPRTEADAIAVRDAIAARHNGRSEAGVALSRALLDAYRRLYRSDRVHDAFVGVVRELVGAPLTEILDLPPAPPQRSLPWIRRLHRVDAALLRDLPALRAVRERLTPGVVGWRTRGMAGGVTTFEPTSSPERTPR